MITFFIWTMKWGVISTKELDEAIMLESALFGDISERASARSSKDSNLHSGLGGSRGLSMQPANHYLSANSGEQQRLREQRCLREQQVQAPCHNLQTLSISLPIIHKLISFSYRTRSIICHCCLTDKRKWTLWMKLKLIVWKKKNLRANCSIKRYHIFLVFVGYYLLVSEERQTDYLRAQCLAVVIVVSLRLRNNM